jgi:hypothetical protein
MANEHAWADGRVSVVGQAPGLRGALSPAFRARRPERPPQAESLPHLIRGCSAICLC